MNNLGENIVSLRKEKNMTQEALGAIVGVSMQAVSKWENGGLPDATLLPAIADALGVSIDALFGRSSPSNVHQALAEDIDSHRGAQLYPRLLDLVWTMKHNLFRRTDDNKPELTGLTGWSQDMSPNGLFMMRLNPDLRYAFIAPKPDCGWRKALLEPEAQSEFFALLGNPDALRLLIFLHERDYAPFTAKYVEKQTGVAAEHTAELMKAFSKYQLAVTEELALDESTQTVYRARPNPAVVPFLAFAMELIHRPNSFYYQNGLNFNCFAEEQ